MAPPLKKSRFEHEATNVEGSRSNGLVEEESILSLPDEIIILIFSGMTTEDRAVLGSVCKRFRHLDFELAGRSFSTIKVEYDSTGQTITTSGPDYIICGSETDPIQATHHNLRLFRKAKVDFLVMKYIVKYSAQGAEKMQNDFGIIASIFKTVKFNKLFVHFDTNTECSNNFLPEIFANRDLTNAQTDVISQTNSDSILLHITKATNHAELRGIDFTARAILDAYELLCISPLATTKLVKFSVSEEICDELFGMVYPDIARREIPGWKTRRLLHQETRSALIARRLHSLDFFLCKVDADFETMYRNVSFT